MTKQVLQNVNIFQGTRGSVKPEEGSLFSRWNLLKGKAGNNSPAACLPFGNVSCSPYSGGYSSGYGNFMRNGGEEPKEFFKGDKIVGFSHFNHSGTGGIGLYYNYLLTIPFKGKFADIHGLKEFDEEKASVGYYTCRLKEENICAEVTVADKVAIHKYTSLDGKPFKIAVDISNDGLLQAFDEKVFSCAEESEMRIDGESVVGFVIMQGVKLYFCIACKGKATLWLDKNTVQQSVLRMKKTQLRFGALFAIEEDYAFVKVGFSFLGEKEAKEAVNSAPDFDKAKEIAEKAWVKRLSTIELFGVSDRDREIFYSNYYHTLIKPCGWKNESFLWQEKETFYCDFATLWDIYKTQTPLLFTLHSDIGRGIVKTLLRYGKETKKLFNALLLSNNMNIEATQACCLGCYVLYDAYIRGLIEENEIEDLFAVVKAEIGQYEKTIKDGTFEKTTKLLDCTLIAQSFADIAKELGREEDYGYLVEIAKHWTDAFGEDGLLKKEYPYYEGNHWNYSFRFVHDVEKRIALSGGKEKLIEQLDAFFAFNEENGIENRFEGFNNETDMETPYFYHYVGRYDSLICIMRECLENCFQTGRDGVPGNNDSGGLSSCYLWNYLGIFPVSGQRVMLLGIPKAEKVILHFSSGKDLTIFSQIKEETINKITFNGKEIEGYAIDVSLLQNGGELIFS